MDKNKVLATVGNRNITEEDLNNLINGLDPKAAAQFNSDEGRKMLLEELINQELLYIDAVNSGMEDSKEYKEELERSKVTILKQLAMAKLLGGTSLSEGEVIDYYNQNKEHFKSPDTVKASHILVPDEAKAMEVLDEINAGLSFDFAAKKHSSCPSKEAGGDLGYFPKGSMVPEFGKAAFEMNVGEISKPVKTQFGYHIIKVVDKKEGGYKPLDEVKNQLMQQILLKKQQDIYLKKTAELRGRYEVKFNQ